MHDVGDTRGSAAVGGMTHTHTQVVSYDTTQTRQPHSKYRNFNPTNFIELREKDMGEEERDECRSPVWLMLGVGWATEASEL